PKEVHVEHRLQVACAQVRDATRDDHACVVDYDVDATELGDGFAEAAGNGGRFGDVGRRDQDARSRLASPRRGFGERLSSARHQYYVGSGGAELDPGLSADAARGAGDQYRFADEGAKTNCGHVSS